MARHPPTCSLRSRAQSVPKSERGHLASVAGRAVRLGIRSQSLAYYVPTETALQLAATVRAIVGYCASNPAHYHLMVQRTAPGFTPSEESHAQALAALQVLLRRSP